MKAKDVKVGEYYAINRWSSRTRRDRGLVLSVGEKFIYGKKGHKGIELRLDDGRVTIMSGYYIDEPWADYERKEQARQERAKRASDAYKAMDALQGRLVVAFCNVGLSHVGSTMYHDHLSIKLSSPELIERLCEVLERAAEDALTE